MAALGSIEVRRWGFKGEGERGGVVCDRDPMYHQYTQHRDVETIVVRAFV